MDIYSTIFFFILAVAFISIYVGSAVWAVNDAQKRGFTGGVIIALIWLSGPFAAVVWRFFRPSTMLSEKERQNYDNADDAISAASQLEMLGNWDAAIALYENASSRWPEHQRYAQQCVRRIQSKRNHDVTN